MSQKPKRLEISPEDLEKIARRKRQHEASNVKVSPEELFVAEFGYYYGWDAMMAVLNNEIDFDTANKLLTGARKVWSGKLVDSAIAMFTAAASAQSGKKAKNMMAKGLKEFIKASKADM